MCHISSPVILTSLPPIPIQTCHLWLCVSLGVKQWRGTGASVDRKMVGPMSISVIKGPIWFTRTFLFLFFPKEIYNFIPSGVFLQGEWWLGWNYGWSIFGLELLCLEGSSIPRDPSVSFWSSKSLALSVLFLFLGPLCLCCVLSLLLKILFLFGLMRGIFLSLL